MTQEVVEMARFKYEIPSPYSVDGWGVDGWRRASETIALQLNAALEA